MDLKPMLCQDVLCPGQVRFQYLNFPIVGKPVIFISLPQMWQKLMPQTKKQCNALIQTIRQLWLLKDADAVVQLTI